MSRRATPKDFGISKIVHKKRKNPFLIHKMRGASFANKHNVRMINQYNEKYMKKCTKVLWNIYKAAPDKLKKSHPEVYNHFQLNIIMSVPKDDLLDCLKNMSPDLLMEYFENKELCNYMIRIINSTIHSTNSLKEKKELKKIMIIYKKFKQKMKNRKKKLRKHKQKMIKNVIKQLN